VAKTKIFVEAFLEALSKSQGAQETHFSMASEAYSE
jgi:hypothetical protein